MFYEPETLSGAHLDAFLANGWYRMRQMIFTQSHYSDEPSASDRPVWWLRFPLAAIAERPSQRKLKRRNRRFKTLVLEPFENKLEYEALYERYFEKIDFDGYPSVGGALFEDWSDGSIYHTCAIALYDGSRLAGMGIFDLGTNSCASILHFYDPDYARHSLGRYLVLLTVDLLRERGYEWYYPGYVVPGNPKFDYKLFLGKDCAEYFHTGEQSWKPFEDRILDPGKNPPNTTLEHSLVLYDEDDPPPFL
jgi:arginyl-tRNA--protein-N-Asp/Glu arginylyltransferase